MPKTRKKYTSTVQFMVEDDVFIKLVNNAFDKRMKFPDYMRMIVEKELE